MILSTDSKINRQEGLVLLLLFSGLFLFFLSNSSMVAGGVDSYGYVSQALRIANGHLYEPEQIFSQFGLEENSRISRPVGYVSKDTQGTVPRYPFGYPLLMAFAFWIGGIAGMYWAVPLLSACTVVFTYLFAERFIGKAGGVVAAALILLLPNYLFSSFLPMSDVPATFFSLLFFFSLFCLPSRFRSDLLIGALLGFCIWIRPNMFLLSAAVITYFVCEKQMKRFAGVFLGFLPFFVVLLLINYHLFGAVWNTGYRDIPMTTSLQDAFARGLRYLMRLQDQQAQMGIPLLIGGILFGRVPWRMRLALVSTGAVFLVFFAFYSIDDEWWYGRFLLPVIPVVAFLEASFIVYLWRLEKFKRFRTIVLCLGGLVFVFFSVQYSILHRVFQLKEENRRYPLAADFVQKQIIPPALIIASQHSGTLRWYGRLPTVRYDLGPYSRFVSRLREVTGAGGRLYLLAEEAEIKNIESTDRAAILEGARFVGKVEPYPVFLYEINFNAGPGPPD